MQTVSSLADRLDMTPEEAVEKLKYMLIDIQGVDAEIDDDLCDLLIDVDEDPAFADKVREDKLKKQEAEKRAAERRAKRKPSPRKKPAKSAETETTVEVLAAPEAARGPVAEILGPAGEETQVAAAPAEEPFEARPAPEKKVKKPKVKKKKEAGEAPSIVIGSAIEHEERRAEVVRADGTHVTVEEVDVVEPDTGIEEEEEEEIGLLAEAERRQEEEERRKAKAAKPLAKPDPAVVAEVIRKASLKRETEVSPGGDVLDDLRRSKRQRKAKSAAASAAGGGTRKTGKTARKRSEKD